MHTVALIILILSAGLLPATARLGWTLEQCEKQYGSPEESDLGPRRLIKATNFTSGISSYFVNSGAGCAWR
jgi:hypothetical protein